MDFTRVLSLLGFVKPSHLYPLARLQTVCQPLPALRGGKRLFSLSKRESWKACGHQSASFTSVVTGLAVHMMHLCLWRPGAGFCWQLAEVSLFQGRCWSHIMLMMNLSSHHITHPSNYLPLYSALVWVIIRVLLIKPPLMFYVLITAWNGLRTELRSTELTGSPNLLHLR